MTKTGIYRTGGTVSVRENTTINTRASDTTKK